jgi:hypothetical protein
MRNQTRTPVPSEKYAELWKDEPIIEVKMVAGTKAKGWTDGLFQTALNAFGYPLEWYPHEVRKIPAALYDWLVSKNAPVTLQVDTRSPLQPKYDLIVKRWREERDAKLKKANEQYLRSEVDKAVKTEQAEEKRREEAKLRQAVIKRMQNEI